MGFEPGHCIRADRANMTRAEDTSEGAKRLFFFRKRVKPPQQRLSVVSERRRSSTVSERRRSSTKSSRRPSTEKTEEEELEQEEEEEEEEFIERERAESIRESDVPEWELILVQSLIRGYLVRLRQERLVEEILKEVAAVVIQRFWRRTKAKEDIGLDERVFTHSLCRMLVRKLYQDISATFIQRWWRKKRNLSRQSSSPGDSQSADTERFANTKQSLAYFVYERADVVGKWWLVVRRKYPYYTFITCPDGLRNLLIGHFICRILVFSLLRDVAATHVQRWWRKKKAFRNTENSPPPDSFGYKGGKFSSKEGSTDSEKSLAISSKSAEYASDRSEKELTTKYLADQEKDYDDHNATNQQYLEKAYIRTQRQTEDKNVRREETLVKGLHFFRSSFQLSLNEPMEISEEDMTNENSWAKFPYENGDAGNKKQIITEHSFLSRDVTLMDTAQQFLQVDSEDFEGARIGKLEPAKKSCGVITDSRELAACALIIQCWWRGHVAKQSFEVEVAALIVQNHFRQKKLVATLLQFNQELDFYQ